MMAGFKDGDARQFYSETYDEVMSDWPDGIEFYTQLAVENVSEDDAVLELACGTGRMALRLAELGFYVVGLNSSPVMLSELERRVAGC